MKTKLSFQKSMKAAAFAALSSALVNAILFYIFHAAGVITDTIFIKDDQYMTVVPILISSIVPSLIAGLVFFLFETYTNNGFKIFSIVSIILLILSFLNPFLGIKGVTVAYAIALNIMHITLVVALFYFIKKEIKANSAA